MSGPAAPPPVHFLCQKCGNCCRWPGEVILTTDEVLAIASHLDLPPLNFTASYTSLRRNRQGLTLTTQPDGTCIFLHQNRCAIQPVKPTQCRGFPNEWNFPGWRDLCEAIPFPDSTPPSHAPSLPGSNPLAP